MAFKIEKKIKVYYLTAWQVFVLSAIKEFKGKEEKL